MMDEVEKVEQREPEPIALEQNPELDAFLNDNEGGEGEQQEASKKPEKITDKQAAQIAFKGLSEGVMMVSKFTGKEIVFGEFAAKVTVSLFCPLVKKYGTKLDFIGGKVDLNGWMPEVMGIFGVGVAAIVVGPQIVGEVVEGEVDEHAGK